MKHPKQGLELSVARVVDSGNCSGCGVCAGIFSGVQMQLSADGFMRPNVTHTRDQDAVDEEVTRFERVCPGVRVTAPPKDAHADHHPIFGRSYGVWEGWSTDPEVRRAGSSGGVLTTISSFLREKTSAPGQMVAADASRPTRSIPVRIMSRDEALGAAGSRYAPVSVGAHDISDLSSVTGKPCEIAAFRAANASDGNTPVLLSFFCAGTPSQRATDVLIERLGHSLESVSSTRYRGEGWPGQFVVTSEDGRRSSMSYEESWGAVLGKQLQDRCKICVDGTGESADVAVGDFWESNEAGYPLFEDSDGRSVVIARSPRGLAVIEECVRIGLLELRPVGLDAVAAIQPLQVKRRQTLTGRLLGRVITGQRIPTYVGYDFLRTSLRHPVENLRALAGTVRRRLQAPKKRL